MTRRATTTIILACAVLAATTGAAQAKTTTEFCGLESPASPVIHASSSITSTGGVGRCNVTWRAIATIEVEQDGSWQAAFAGGEPVPGQVDGPYTARVDHRTDYQWGVLDPSPYCSYSWRIAVRYVNTAGTQISTAYSPETFRTCPTPLRA